MRKRQNTLDATKMLNGVSYGEHVMNADDIVGEVSRLTEGCANTFIVRCNPEKPLSRESYKNLALFAKEKGLHFGFLYAYQFPPKGKRSHFDKELIQMLKDIAGDLFIGEFFGEAGSDKAAKDRGYYVEGHEVLAYQLPPQNRKTMSEAREFFVDFINKMTTYDKELGLDDTFLVEATALSCYNLEGGIKTPILEVLPGNPENLIPFTRGSAIGYERENWGGFIACEWYGGYRHEDVLKKARLELVYKYLYMQGANLTFLESGNHEIKSFGYNLDENHEICKYYRKTVEDFQKFIEENKRLPYGPYAKVGFIMGEDDGYTDFLGGSSWCQFDREEWGKGDAERSWNILTEVYRSSDWHDPSAFSDGENDQTGAPAYGTYDVIPAKSPLSVMQSYDYLIFAGWNTMNSELYEKLKKYVENGGVLLASACHLSTNAERGGKREYINGGDLTDLFGVKIVGEERRNSGVKFTRDSFREEIKYPGTTNMICDCNYPTGFSNWVKTELVGATKRCVFCNTFFQPPEPSFAVMTENKLGKGLAIFMCNADYSGNPSVYPLYKVVVKAILAGSAQKADLKVVGSDKVRFSLFYDDKGNENLYLLNTAYSQKSVVTVKYKEWEKEIILSPLELKRIDFKND